MNTEYKVVHNLLTACAVNRLDKDADSELLALISEQHADDTGRAPAEYLGGNGVTQWGHCKGNDKADKYIDDDHDDDITGTEIELMSYFVAQHQSGIESNGRYIVRDLAHWKGGYKADVHAERTERKHVQALGLPRSVSRKDRTKAGLAERKARKLARMRARRGIK